ncbi:MAG: tRNA epoxyqueuosine(34) reductase QueG [Parabacteroides sp.]
MLSAQQIKALAADLGFAACGVARVESVAQEEQKRFDRWIAEGCQAEMRYMENHRSIRFNPEGLVEGAKSLISVALNYYPARRRDPADPHIAYYAYGKDYHIVVKEKLRGLWQALTGTEGEEARCFTDSAPLLERYWAWKAGLGWIGKHTQLVLPGKGSFFFLGEIVTTAEVDRYDRPMPSRCGRCTRCVEACPAKALTAPHTLDARRCLSYLTIEHRGEWTPEQAAPLGNRLYGCDTCQLVCPWNRFATPTQESAFQPSPELLSLKKEQLSTFSKEEYNRIFAQSAVKRAKYEGMMRTINHLIKS